MTIKPTYLALLAAALLGGCVTYPGVGTREADTPPQIIENKDGLRTWDAPGKFGPVPAEKAAAGATVCATLDTNERKHEALGYHSKALDLQGKPFPSGGYYCVPKR